jgi:hypothetical protein
MGILRHGLELYFRLAFSELSKNRASRGLDKLFSLASQVQENANSLPKVRQRGEAREI